MSKEQTAYLLGLDFGSTTSSCLVTQANVFKNPITGRVELRDTADFFRSEAVFTPFRADNPHEIDEDKLGKLLHHWIHKLEGITEPLLGGGAILTGLAAQSKNAIQITQKIKQHCQDAIIATAEDPHFESWLAFMGGALAISKQHPNLYVVNLDIGGGTTNLAVGIGGEVIRTGSVFIGARHLQFVPGGYQITHITQYGQLVLDYLSIAKQVYDTLTASEVHQLTQFYVQGLQALSEGNAYFFIEKGLKNLIQAPWVPFNISENMETSRVDKASVASGPPISSTFLVDHSPAKNAGSFCPPYNLEKPQGAIITFTGGVGELVYAHAVDENWPGTTFFGDLGIALAEEMAHSDFGECIERYEPLQKGRATLYGIALSSTEFSGNTIFVSDSITLPLDNVPVLAALQGTESELELKNLMTQANQFSCAVCFYVNIKEPSLFAVKTLGEKLSRIFAQWTGALHPLVLLVPHNIGHALGCYATTWKKIPIPLLVLDEVSFKEARFIRIGKPYRQVIPVTFYGFGQQQG